MHLQESIRWPPFLDVWEGSDERVSPAGGTPNSATGSDQLCLCVNQDSTAVAVQLLSRMS